MEEGGVFLLLTVSLTGERCTSHRISERKKKGKTGFPKSGGSSRGKEREKRGFHVPKVESKGRKTRDLRKWDYEEGRSRQRE